jgi:hypothetical protein
MKQVMRCTHLVGYADELEPHTLLGHDPTTMPLALFRVLVLALVMLLLLLLLLMVV